MMYLMRKPPKVIMNKFRCFIWFYPFDWTCSYFMFYLILPDEFSRILKCIIWGPEIL
jgi:hypothetical protein